MNECRAMGRTSKFSFPIPGRRSAAGHSGKGSGPGDVPPLTASQSKASRILGTGASLNIDAPLRDDASWRYPSSKSSAMSISISESTAETASTRSVQDNESFPGSYAPQEQQDAFERPRLRGKASSTLLGSRHGEDVGTDTSSVRRKMRHEDSSSTLKSYYDRNKSPLAISQQTSNSSARDLALRKGLPPVIPPPGLPELEKAVLTYGGDEESDDYPRDKSSKKKPTRLDLSSLFPMPGKKHDKTPNTANSSILTPDTGISQIMGRTRSNSGRRKLQKAPSKESLQSTKQSIRSNISHSSRHPDHNAPQYNSHHDNYDYSHGRPSPHMTQIPESRVLDGSDIPPQRQSGKHLTPQPVNGSRIADPQQLSPHGPFSWKNVRQSMASPHWEQSSAASISSRNTKTSRHTSASAFSNSDLQQNSVLSLSSESEGENSDTEPSSFDARSYTSTTASVNAQKISLMNPGGRYPPGQQNPRAPSSLGRSHPPKQQAPQSNPYLTIPESSSNRPSHNWQSQLQADQGRSHKEKRYSKASTTTTNTTATSSSMRSTQHTSPPTSPTSMEVPIMAPRSSRMMAVTKQEEALLEALRQKRALMREQIIEEHKIEQRSPPRAPSRTASRATSRTASRYSQASSVSTIRGNPSTGKERILLYLDQPLDDEYEIDTAEPSPDLSDFLSFESDEESRREVMGKRVSKDHVRPNSVVTARRRSDKYNSGAPAHAARHGSVRSRSSSQVEEEHGQRRSGRNRSSSGVRFADNGGRYAQNQDYALGDLHERDEFWGI
ncbi:hypothetical protein F5884DRAFT_522114 [Xylogone sp. PMI_703]|nr:hypothetical protein F5884DRAFT_522114 [Xylogone sp. PMI_703]